MRLLGAHGARPLRSRHRAPAAAGCAHDQHPARSKGQPVRIRVPAARARARGVGLIQGYTALIDQQKAGFPVNVFVSITLDRQSQADLQAFEERGAQGAGSDGVLSHDRRTRLSAAPGGRRHGRFRARAQPASDAPAACGAGAFELCGAHRAEVARTAAALLGACRVFRGLRVYFGRSTSEKATLTASATHSVLFQSP